MGQRSQTKNAVKDQGSKRGHGAGAPGGSSKSGAGGPPQGALSAVAAGHDPGKMVSAPTSSPGGYKVLVKDEPQPATAHRSQKPTATPTAASSPPNPSKNGYDHTSHHARSQQQHPSTSNPSQHPQHQNIQPYHPVQNGQHQNIHPNLQPHPTSHSHVPIDPAVTGGVNPYQQNNLAHPHHPHAGAGHLAPTQSPIQQHPRQGGSQHQSPYVQTQPLPGHPQHQDNIYFAQQSPYQNPQGPPEHYSHEGDLMAASMNRPYPPMYHTPQSNSPASVASPTAHDHRGVYGGPGMQQQMYGYPQQYAPMPPQHPYGHQPQPHQMTQPPMPLMSQQQVMHQQSPQHANIAPNPPRQKIAQSPAQQQQRPPPTSAPPQSNGAGNNVNHNAAPGPIPATTPLVVRQDGNGVQWIAFEYSRDRVKMEYTIRCDVESVNVDNLTQEFKTENCVYPRACCSKDQYRGNRLVYETECNQVGWALADLNPCLRGKRGLIQRAVDSWRNSNQDPRLRSRRVRRMAKINNRKATLAAAAAQVPSLQGSPYPGTIKPPQHSAPSSAQQLHHHHHASGEDGREDDMNMMHHHHNTSQFGVMGGGSRSSSGHLSPTTVNDSYTNGHALHHDGHGTDELRHRQIFHGYPNYPAQPSGGPSMPPVMHDGMDPMGQSSAHATAVSTSAPPTSNMSLFGGDLPEHKKRKFILVDDPHRGSRVRVRVMLDQVEMDEIPDSYRKTNSVFPRSFIPITPQSPSTTEAYLEKQTTVSLPMADGSNMRVSRPPVSSSTRRKEEALNELGYRMSWSQSRVFAGRTIFLQRALDAYRNKMRSSLMSAGQDVSEVAPHLETRAGKRRWNDRKRRSAPPAPTGSD